MKRFVPVPMLTIDKLVSALEAIAAFVASKPATNELNLIGAIAFGTLSETKAEIEAIRDGEPSQTTADESLQSVRHTTRRRPERLTARPF